mmetsp:Transcript_20274/g.22962  ORF Transcript_20274/g.22962 Transcript_20274/m.22962 type:complete len:119 (-) Transcript_20274:276-632(-)
MEWQRILGGVSGAMSVATGAYGVHGFRGKQETYKTVFETGSRYQLMHSVLLVATPAICGGSRNLKAKIAGSCFIAGMGLFSGSCYAVGLTEDRKNGKLAPFGGFCLMGGWLALAFMRK